MPVGGNTMAKYRSGRLAGEIQKEVAEILSRELKDPRLNMATVVDVSVAPDGCSAKIYISPMTGAGHDAAQMKQALESAKGFIRRELSRRLQVRNVPELYFHVDESIARAIRMTGLIERQIAADEAAAKNRPPQEEGIYKE